MWSLGMLKHTGSVGVAAITAFSLQLFPHSLTTMVFILTVEIIFVTLHSPHSQPLHPSPPYPQQPFCPDEKMISWKQTKVLQQVAYGGVSSRVARSRIKAELRVWCTGMLFAGGSGTDRFRRTLLVWLHCPLLNVLQRIPPKKGEKKKKPHGK